MSDEIFEKADNPPPVEKKPKKKVSQATLDALARGREKMRLKREADKKAKAEGKEVKKVTKENEKIDNKGAKQDIKQKRTQRKTQGQLKKEQEALEAVMDRERTRERLARIERYQIAKCKMLERCASVKVYNELNSVLEQIDEDTICDDDRLAERLMSVKTSLENQDDFEMKQMVDKHQGSISIGNQE